MSVTKKFKIDPKISAKIHEQLRALDETQAPAIDQDQEIDQIMSEIESLQKRVSEPAGLRIVPDQPSEDHEPSSIMDEFRAGSSDEPSMEETLSDLRDEGPSGPSLLDDPVESPSDESLQETNTEDFEEESPQETNTEDFEEEGETMSNFEGDGTMTMVLNGSMTLKLKYEVDGQEVTIGFADKMLKVQLADGTEFKIPIRPARMIKKAA
jgi:hypothetical protein